MELCRLSCRTNAQIESYVLPSPVEVNVWLLAYKLW